MSASPDQPMQILPPEAPRAAMACRRMVDGDIDAAIELLTSGFAERPADYWQRALQRLRERPVPDGMPRYGYVLTDGGRLVGILLILFATTDAGIIRGNVSSWYVEPAYRGFSNLLLSALFKLKNVVLFNISPAPTTIDTIRAQGFMQYASGTFQSLAALAPPVFGARIRRIHADDGPSILADHAAFGCLSFEVSYQGKTFPFVFQPVRILGRKLSSAQLVYCRNISEFECFAGPLGRRLLLLGLPLVLLDANGPLTDIPGWYRPSRGRRFYRGAEPPRLGDVSYSELVVFGP